MDTLKALGAGPLAPTRDLETFACPEGVTAVFFKTEELTALCPVTGQPDYYSCEVRYLPSLRALESKSLKLYFATFRSEGVFAEMLADRIAQDIFIATDASYVHVTLQQQRRGGLTLEVEAERVA